MPQLQALTPLHVERMYSELLSLGLSPRTVAERGIVLGRALGDAVRWGLRPDNPASGTRARKPRWTAPEMRALDPAEARAVMAAAMAAETELVGAKYARAVELALATALRIGEILGLQWQDVGETALTVQRSLGDDGETPGPTKSAAGVRTVPLAQQAREALRRQRLWQKQERLAWGPAWKQTGYVFTHENGEAIGRRTLGLWF
ncbi:MAG: tyrosine-type recombinase/integrase [Firmicutes bacterium]|nr:tyrosine-type recombinase/integrase [Bacillota bacterium]